MDDKKFEEIQYVEQTNQCPKCKSNKITIHKGVEFSVEENMATGKILRRSKSGTTTFWVYKCRSCDWVSETCCE